MANMLLLTGMAVFVVSDYSEVSGSGDSGTQSLIAENSAGQDEAVNPLDNLSSSSVAVHISRMTRIDEATAVTNKADTVSAQQAVTPADDQVIAKPQVISTDLKTRKDIEVYKAKPGDTVSSVANKFGVTTNTIRASNNLSGEEIAAGARLLISPVDGIVYRVKPGDTPQSLAAKYLVSKEQLIAFNDAELSGKFKVGELIIIPDGRRSASVASLASTGSPSGGTTGYGFAYGGGGPVYSGNAYDYGYCTYWAALRRAQIGRPIPSNLGNAISWRDLAISAGFPVGSSPKQGAVVWFPSIGGYGHVAFVERVRPNGSFTISEMNFQGWGVRNNRTFSANEAANYRYIY